MDINAFDPASVCEKHAEALTFIRDVTRNCDSVQRRVLAEILAQNGNTEYLGRYGVDGATDREAYKSRVPMITYEDVQDDIQRIADGDYSPILSGKPISEFLTSSGTSGGERKLMPTIHDELDRRTLLYSLLMPVMNLYVPDLDKGKGLYFLFVKVSTKTPGGLLARPVLTSYYNSEHFKTRPHDPYMSYTSPNDVILCTESFQSMYCQMLCGLYQQKEVLRLGAIFASGLIRAIHFLQLYWQELAHDIATGTLSSRITDPVIRECFLNKLPYVKPNPKLAEFIAKECSGDRWEGIITRIWPNTKYLDVIVTGAMAQYIPTLEYYSNGLPLLCTMYASSECYFGLNLTPVVKPSEVSYTIMPNMGYFEFLPHNPTAAATNTATLPPPRLVDLADVEVGKDYELVITTYGGLYRYQVGDILHVTGFHNSAPQFRFVRRKNVLLSIDSDKTDEAELQKGIDNAMQLLTEYETTVVEYTSNANTSTIPGHYVLYWELMVKNRDNYPTHDVLDQCCLAIEESLNSVYRQCRVCDNSIGPLEIRIVRHGAFEELMDYAILRGASINQYKAPRCVDYRPIVEVLDSSVVSRHFSPSLPHWTPNRKQ